MRGFLLASVSTAALASTAWAGETPKAMQAMASAPMSWTGFYAGLDLGWLGNRSSVEELEFGVVPGFSTSPTLSEFIGGGHVGYNWQYQQFVLGAEADISGASGSHTVSYGPPGFSPDTFSSSINWLSTFRGRLGVAFDQWLVYGTAGWAFAGVHNTRTSTSLGPINVDQTKTGSGFVWGGGVEYMVTRNWTARVEAMAVNLGDSTILSNTTNGPYITHFTNKAVVARGGVSFIW